MGQLAIYKAYLDYGPYEGEQDLGYFESVAGAYDAVVKSAKQYNFALNHPEVEDNQTVYPAMDYEGTYNLGYKFVIQRIEVRP